MTLTHVAEIHFGGKFEAAKKRVQKLKAAGLIAERPRRRYQRSILRLTHPAFGVLVERRQLDGYPPLAWQTMEKRARVSEMTITHELSVLDVKATFIRAARETGRLAMTTFQTWPLLYAFRVPGGRERRAPTWVKPDGFSCIREQRDNGETTDHLFYLEIDRGTETHDTLCRRVARYRDHYRSGGMAAMLGHPRDDYQHFPFRVLAVFRNPERRNNAAAALLRNRPPALRQIWLTTLPEVLADPLAPIWIRPIDYRESIRGTPFDIGGYGELFYRRQTDRETHVERNIAKRSLFSA
jgi:hypothetical protein